MSSTKFLSNRSSSNSQVTLSWQQLHSLIDLPCAQDRDVEFTGVSSLEAATESQISFLGNPRYQSQLKSTNAGLVLVPVGHCEANANSLLLEVENPSAAFAQIVDFFQPALNSFTPGISPAAYLAEDVSIDPQEVSIGPGAVIEAGASIGRGSVIGAGCVIGRMVHIGEDCYLHANVTIRERCVLGNRVILQPGVVIGSDGYGYELIDGHHQKVPQVGTVEIADDVEIGANTTVDRARFGCTSIGQGTKIDNLVQIAHNVSIGKHCLIVSQAGIAGSTKIGDYVTIAAQAGVAGHLEISDHVMIGARGGVFKNLTKAGAYIGLPARPIAEEQRKMALVSRLPKIVSEMREMKKKLEETSS